MKCRFKVFLLSLFSFLSVFLALAPKDVVAQREVDFPDPEGYVNDFANVLNNDEELEERLRLFAEKESTQIFVITTDKLPEGTDIYSFVPRLTDANPKWRAGQDEYDNGIIFTVVLDTREMAIDVGYGLEGALPDITAKSILDDEVKPYFKQGDYSGGVEAGVGSIMEAVKGEYEGSGGAGTQGGEGSDLMGQFCAFLFIGAFFVIPYLAAFLGRTKSWWLGGVLGFIFGVILSVVFVFVLSNAFRYLLFCFLVPGLTLAGLFFDFILSRNYKARKKKGLSTSWLSSFGGFASGSSFGSSSFGGGGGFSGGGGGSFGGGGARSSW